MKERTDLTIRRTTDIPVLVTDTNGEYPTSRIDRDSLTFTVSPEEADAQVSRLRDDNKVLTFQKGHTEYLIPVRHVVQVERFNFIPNPSTVELLEAPDGTLYLGRTDEDERIVYPAAFESDRDSNEPEEDGALGLMGYRWVDEGEDPAQVTLVEPVPRPSGLKRVATYSHGKVHPALHDRDELEAFAGPAARQYIGEKAISRRLADNES